ncbi:F-box only protein 6 isoform X2 [Orussus abietinus]|nr:F-box only protein 6 isoform X2 [Orussus abietinus]
MEPRVPFDENGDNGLIMGQMYIPEELLSEILFYVDPDSLLNCKLVCKRWNVLIQTYIWRKKAEAIVNGPLPLGKDIPWYVYYAICAKKSFERNLLKNHSGQYGNKHWKILSDGGNCWKVECPPVGVPDLPDDPVFEKKQHCFVTSYDHCTKEQTVDLIAEGLSSHLLDSLQPPIVVSEWYASRWDCPAVYECSARLLGEDKSILDSFQFHDIIETEKQNKWLHMSHEFRNYGSGVRKVSFYHGGMDRMFWAGHYGSKMAGACVLVKIPESQKCDNDDSEDSLLDVD